MAYRLIAFRRLLLTLSLTAGAVLLGRPVTAQVQPTATQTVDAQLRHWPRSEYVRITQARERAVYLLRQDSAAALPPLATYLWAANRDSVEALTVEENRCLLLASQDFPALMTQLVTPTTLLLRCPIRFRPPQDRLLEAAQAYARRHAPQLEQGLQASGLSAEEKAFVRLYAVATAAPAADSTQARLAREVAAFRQQYPGSPLASMIYTTPTGEYDLSKVAFGMAGYVGALLPGGPLSTRFRPFPTMGASGEATWQRWSAGARLAVGLATRPRTAFSYHGQRWYPERPVSATQADITLAYAVYARPRVRVAPFAGLGLLQIGAAVDEKNNPGEGKLTMNFRQPLQGGLVLDVRLGGRPSAYPQYPRADAAYLRVRAGVRAATATRDAELHGLMSYVEAGLLITARQPRHRQQYQIGAAQHYQRIVH